MKDRTGLPKERVTVDVKDCARCGKDHKQLVFTSLTRPGPRHNFWSPCPTNGEPIMMVVTTDAEPEARPKPPKRKRKRTWKEKGWYSPTQAFGPRSVDC